MEREVIRLSQKITAWPGWKLSIILVPWLLSIATFLFGIIEYQAANRKPFLEKQMEVTFEAADAAAILATTTDMEQWKTARRTFMRLKYGQLRIVEDRELSLAMAEFWNALPAEDTKDLRLPLAHLGPEALNISTRSRELIARSWHADLEPGVQ